VTLVREQRMKLSNIANVFDVEHDDGRLIEIGLTTVSLKDRQILQSHSIAIKPDFELTAEISKLTGWTQAKLLKRGITKEEASRRLDGYGSNNRLLVTDHSDEIPFLEAALGRTLSPHRLNVSVMVALFTGNDINLGLEQMLALYNLQFEGKLHSGIDDSRNIARLFLKLLPEHNLSQSPLVDTTHD
jgi:DNA polymerase III alpha subunit (gram-positive type)